MQTRAVLLVAACLGVAACERPTAPQARDVALQVEKELARGNLDAYWGKIAIMPNMASMFGIRPTLRDGVGLAISRDGLTETVNAIIVENVFVPPEGMGKPLVRRTLAAWPESRLYAMSVIAERHPSELSTDSTSGYYERLLGPSPRAFARLQFPDVTHRWVPQSGTVHIGDPVVERPCETQLPRHLHGMAHAPDDVSCEIALFEVRLDGVFTRAADMARPLWRVTAPRHELTVATQRLPGVRFVTRCPEAPRDWHMPPASGHPCWNWGTMHHWRDNELFAQRLGVDVTAMSEASPVTGGRFYGRVIPLDSKTPRGPYVQWTLHRPDGVQALSGSFPLEYPGDRAHFPEPEDHARDLVRAYMTAMCGSLTCGRVQAIVPAYAFDSRTSLYAMLVLHAEPSAVP